MESSLKKKQTRERFRSEVDNYTDYSYSDISIESADQGEIGGHIIGVNEKGT